MTREKAPVDGTTFAASLEERRLQDAAATGEAAWRRLGLHLRSITPAGLARFLLASAALAVVGWLVAAAWLSLIPLQVGLVLAYLVMPIVDVLDRVLPRWLAALVVALGEIVFVLGAIALLIPPLALEAPALIDALPDASQVRVLIDDARVVLTTLPPEVQTAVTSAVQQVVHQLQANLTEVVRLALSVFATGALGVLGTLGFILGFIAVPTWLVAILTDRNDGARAIDRMLPTWLRPDFWAVLRIIDGKFGWYLRGQLVRALVYGCALFVTFSLLTKYDLVDVRYPLSLAAFATLAYLIPEIGPILAALPGVVAALARSPHEAVVVLAAYLGVSFLEQHLVAPRVQEGSIDVHPAVLLPLLIAISQFGFFWLLIGAPLIVVARDLFLYAYGRLGGQPTTPRRI